MSHGVAALGRCLPVPLIRRFGKPNNCACRLDGVAVMGDILTGAPVHSNNDSKMKPAPVGNISKCLVAPTIVAARLTKGKKPRTEWSRPHVVVG